MPLTAAPYHVDAYRAGLHCSFDLPSNQTEARQPPPKIRTVKHLARMCLLVSALALSVGVAFDSVASLASFYVGRVDYLVLSSSTECHGALCVPCERYLIVRDEDSPTGVEFYLEPMREALSNAPISVGTHLIKRRYSFTYTVNGMPARWRQFGRTTFAFFWGLAISLGWLYWGGPSLVRESLYDQQPSLSRD